MESKEVGITDVESRIPEVEGTRRGKDGESSVNAYKQDKSLYPMLW